MSFHLMLVLKLFELTLLNCNLPTHLFPCNILWLGHSHLLVVHKKFMPPSGQSIDVMHSENKVMKLEKLIAYRKSSIRIGTLIQVNSIRGWTL